MNSDLIDQVRVGIKALAVLKRLGVLITEGAAAPQRAWLGPVENAPELLVRVLAEMNICYTLIQMTFIKPKSTTSNHGTVSKKEVRTSSGKY